MSFIKRELGMIDESFYYEISRFDGYELKNIEDELNDSTTKDARRSVTRNHNRGLQMIKEESKEVFCIICEESGADKLCSECMQAVHSDCVDWNHLGETLCPDCEQIKIR